MTFQRRLKGMKTNISSFLVHTFISAVVMTAGAVNDSDKNQGNPLKVTVGVVSCFERNLYFVTE